MTTASAVELRDRSLPLPARIFFIIGGLLLMVVAQLANQSDRFIFAAYGRVFVHLPGTPRYEYVYFPLVLVLIGLPLVLLGIGLGFPRFRRALAAPWRDFRIAAPFVAALFYLAISLAPWDPTNLKPQDTGSWMVFIVITATGGLILLLAGLYQQLGFLDRALGRFYDWLQSLPRWSFIALVAGTMFLLANIVSFFIFEHIPHIQDSISQLFQAKIFASGRLWLPAPPFPDFFDYTHIINIPPQTGHPASGFDVPNWPGPEGRWYSQYTFLHSLLLMLGVFIGAPWIINPLLGAITVGAIYFLGREVYDERTGRLSAALAAVTPFIVNMSGEFMNHSSALLFVTLFLLFFFRTVRTGRWWDAALGGLFWGCAANVRTYSSIAIAVPFFVYAILLVVRRPGLLSRFLVMLLVAGAVASLVLIYNYLTNGHPLLFGYVVKWGRGHEVGFGRSGWGDIHTPLRGLINTGHDMNLLNKFLFEWPLPGILPALILFASGTANRRDWLLASVYLALVVAFFFYWFHNVCFGPRFLYEAAGPLVILTVRGAQSLPALLRRVFALPYDDSAAWRLVSRSLGIIIVFFIAGLPGIWRCYQNYGWVNGKLLRNVRALKPKNALIFCQQFGSGFSANRITLDGEIVYARNLGILNSALTIAYPDREYWYANQDTLRPLPGIAWPGSRLQRALWEMSAAIPDSMLAGYRTLLWPFRDIAPPGHDSALLNTRLADYREVSREIFSGRHYITDYLPALACWILRDDREHLTIFSYMDDVESFVASDIRFTLLYVTSDGSAAIYDVRPVTGNENMVPDRSGTLPLR